MRRFQRTTSGFSKRIGQHASLVALCAGHDHWVKLHRRLGGDTPTMAAGPATKRRDHAWIVELMDARAPKPKRPKTYREWGTFLRPVVASRGNERRAADGRCRQRPNLRPECPTGGASRGHPMRYKLNLAAEMQRAFVVEHEPEEQPSAPEPEAAIASVQRGLKRLEKDARTFLALAQNQSRFNLQLVEQGTISLQRKMMELRALHDHLVAEREQQLRLVQRLVAVSQGQFSN